MAHHLPPPPKTQEIILYPLPKMDQISCFGVQKGYNNIKLEESKELRVLVKIPCIDGVVWIVKVKPYN